MQSTAIFNIHHIVIRNIVWVRVREEDVLFLGKVWALLIFQTQYYAYPFFFYQDTKLCFGTTSVVDIHGPEHRLKELEVKIYNGFDLHTI